MRLGFTNGQQFKANVRNLARKKHINPQLLMQEVVLDEILDRISRSKYRNNLILKGGFLIASMLGIDTRSTRDMDTSIKGMPVSKDEVRRIFSEITGMNEANGDIELKITKIDDIRVAADYAGFRIHIFAKVYTSEVDTKNDVSTGDVITPKEILWSHYTIFNNQKVMVMAYNPEIIIAEKLESIVTRKDLNTRLKDYYDLYLFDKLQEQNINFKTLKSAVLATAKLRGTANLVPKYAQVVKSLRSYESLKSLWVRYQTGNEYARNIDFEETCDAVLDLVNKMN